MKSEKTVPFKFARLWQSILAGMMIGICGILPGVSGGILAVSFGLYRPMLDAVAELFKHPKKSILFLLPIGAGAALGLFLGSVILHSFMSAHYNEIMYLFVGLVIGGIPSFLQEANSGGFKKRWLLFTVLGAALACSLILLKNAFGAAGTDDLSLIKSASDAAEISHLNPIQLILTGAVSSVGVIIPGISTSFILMYLGWYRPALAAVANINIIPLLFIGLGGVICTLLLIKAIRWIFSHFRGYAYYTVLGFLLVSVLLVSILFIFPGFALDLIHVLDLALLVFGFFTAYLMGKMMNKLS